MKTRSALNIGAALIALAFGAGQAQQPEPVSLTLLLEGNALSFAGESLPSIAPNATLSLLIEGDSLPAGSETTWTFTLNDTQMTIFRDNLPNGVNVGYTIRAVPDDSAYTLRFTDSSDPAIELQPIPLSRAAAQDPQERFQRQETGGSILVGPGSDPCSARSYDRERNIARLTFFENGLPVGALPRDLDDNDVINICLAVPTGQDPASYSVQIEGTIRGQDINVLGQGSLGDLRAALAQLQSSAGTKTHTVVLYGTYGPFSAPQITVTVRKVGDEASQRAHVLRINTTYIANLQFGVGISNIRFNEFVLVPDPESTSDEKEIRNRAKNKNEARPMLLVGFYGWPWEKEFWNGRDIEEEPTLFNRVNPMVGIGLRETILDEFLAGVTFELTKGLFVFGAVHVAQVDKLQEGFKQNEPLAVALDSVPTREAWQSDFIWGFSVDLRIAASVLKGIVGTP